MSGAVHGSASQTALMIAHSASVRSVLGFGIDCLYLPGSISTVVESVNNNLYKCKERGKSARSAAGDPAAAQHEVVLIKHGGLAWRYGALGGGQLHPDCAAVFYQDDLVLG